MSDQDDRSINDIVSAVAADLTNLVRAEAELVRAEMSEKISGAVKMGVSMALGAALLWGGYLCVLAAIVIGLSYLMPAAWAALLVGVVAALIGYTLMMGARRIASPESLKPERSARELRKDVQMMKEQVR
ncbi:MAG: phage holin family protein [Alphaproteobacteria bacterium]|nr:phage holin family protein [Alphaproteobacteria bacterium]